MCYDIILKKINILIEKYTIKSICDYGCGTGGLIDQLAKKLNKPIKFTGIEFFTLYSEEKRPQNRKNIKFIDKASDAFKTLLSCKDKYDLIITSFTLHHFKYPIAEIQTINKLLTKDGIIYLLDHSFVNETEENLVTNISSFTDEIIKSFIDQFHRHFYTLDEVLDLFKCINVKILESNNIKDSIQKIEIDKYTKHHLEHIEKKIKFIKNIDKTILRNYFEKLACIEKELVKKYKIDYSNYIEIIAKNES